jgi:hypothetical protein
MSTALAIAAVTAVLRDLLNNGLIDQSVATAVGSVKVTAVAPDLIDLSEFEEPRLNLFLYMVTPNPGWRNAGLPSHTGNGVRLSNPPLALDLHYLLTAYGQEDFHAEILLGYGMQLLHETPVLTKAAITTALTPALEAGDGLPPALQALNASDLAAQVESIRIAPQVMSTEELSRLWSATQAPYRPTAAYMASVVLIESTKRVKAQVGVLTPRVTSGALRGPALREVFATDRADRFLLAGGTAALAGAELAGPAREVLIDGEALIAAQVQEVRANRITVTLPPSLRAGMHSAQVVYVTPVGSPPVLRRGERSNVAGFALHPRVKQRDDGAGRLEDDITVTNLTGTGTAPRSATVTVRLAPDLAPNQEVQLELVRAGALRAIVAAPPPTAATDTVAFAVRDVEAGTYLLRVRVDGAESPFDVNTAGQPVGPTVTFS